MRLIDKHLLRTLITPLFYCLAAFVLVYVIFDLFDNLPDFIDAETPLWNVFCYYLMLTPSVLIYIVPVSLLLSVLYSLSQLTKNNELTAMRSSGVSLYRLMIPFICIGFLASLTVATVNETVGPWSAYWSHQFIRSQRHKGKIVSVYLADNLAYKNEKERRIWLIGTYDTKQQEMTNVELIQQRDAGSDLYKMQAQRGQWLDGRWWLTGVAIQNFSPSGHPMGPPTFERRKELSDCAETPNDFINEIKDPEFLSSLELLEFLQTHQHLSKSTIARFTVDLHSRLAMPWSCFIVTLLGIPFGAQTGRKGAFLGVALSISMFFIYYILINLGLAFGKKELLTPLLSAWIPNLTFFVTGAVLIHRMR